MKAKAPHLVAARRHGKRRTAFAALPVAPAAPLPKKFFDTFWEPCMRAPASPEGEAEAKQRASRPYPALDKTEGEALLPHPCLPLGCVTK